MSYEKAKKYFSRPISEQDYINQCEKLFNSGVELKIPAIAWGVIVPYAVDLINIEKETEERRHNELIAAHRVKTKKERKERYKDEADMAIETERQAMALEAIKLKTANPKLTNFQLAKITGLYPKHTESIRGAIAMLYREIKKIQGAQ